MIQIFKILVFPLVIILLMWIVFLFEIKYGFNFNNYSIYPRKTKSLFGIVASPFLHADLKHIVNNTVSFFILMLLTRFFYKKNYLKVFLISLFFSGLLTWCIARPAYHLGMSGVIYALASFLIFKSFMSKQYNLIAVSFVVIFLYGSMLWYVFPVDKNISWEGHLSGLLVGLILSFFVKLKEPKMNTPEFTIQEHLFLAHFDDNGNFIPNRPFLDEYGNLIIYEEE
jgi:membrane associated rhomboid family serine protease